MAPTAVNTAEQGIELDDEMRAYVRGISRHLARGDRHLAEDIEQETFIVALQHRPRDPKAARAWLWSVARSCLSAVTGRASRRPRTVAFMDEAHAQVGGDPAETHARQELRETLDRALAKLPEDYANVISLRVLDGLPPRAIAAELGVPVNTVRTRTRRGFDRLRTDIDDSLGDDPYSDRRPLLGIGPFFARRWRAAAALVVAVPILVLGFKAFAPKDSGLGDKAQGPGATPSMTGSDVQFAKVTDSDRGLVLPESTGELMVAAAPTTADPVSTSAPILVTVLGVDGLPAAGAELFEHKGFGGTVQRIGETDSQGQARVRLLGNNRYIAARGGPGELSLSLQMNQPSVAAEGILALRLESCPVAWIDVDTSAIGVTNGDVRIEGVPVDQRLYCQLGIEGGISGTSCWVPSWDGPAGREGVVWGDAKKTLCVYVDGIAAASAGPFRLFDAPPDTIAVERPWSLRGKLVSAEGHAITNKLIRFQSRVPSGQSNRRIRTDADGRFEIEGLTTDSVSVESYALQSIAFARPEGPVLDAGSVVLNELVPRLTVHGTVHGVTAPFAIHPITRSGRSTPRAIELTASATRQPIIIRNKDGDFRLSESSDAVLALVVHAAPGGEPIPPTLVTRPKGGWPEDGVQVLVDPNAGAHLRAEIGPDYRPGRVHMRHVDSGFCFTSDVVSDKFQSPTLFAGDWAVSIQGPDGRLMPCAKAKLRAGSDVDLGKLAARSGEVQFSWPAKAVEGDPSDWLYVTLESGGELLLWRAVARRDLERVIARATLSPGPHRIVAQTQGEAYRASFQVVAGERIGCDLK